MFPKNNYSYAKKFGLLLSTIAMAIALFPLLQQKSINIYALVISFVLLLVTLFFYKLLEKPAYLWQKFATILHKILSPIIMLLVYTISIVIVSFVMKIFRRDGLDRKFDSKIDSYWIKRKDKVKDNFKLNDQF